MADNKMGHNKVVQQHEQACVYCGKPARRIEVRYPRTKPGGALGEGRYKLYAHEACLSED